MKVRQGYCFDDVLLVPKYSRVPSRSKVDTSVDLGKGIALRIPIVSANMKNVTESIMAKTITALGGLAILHRFCSLDEQINMLLQNDPKHTAVSIGVQAQDKENAEFLIANGAKIICIDVAHGDHDNCAAMTRYIAETYPDVLLIAGNVATAAGAKTLYNAGANVIKVGIGPGSLCTTRIETGNGVPQLTAIADVAEWRNTNGFDCKIIADGGIKSAGDIVKSLCFADAVMLGSLLAGTDEAPGKTITLDGESYKEYAGSSTFKANHVEGISALVKTKGSVKPIIERLIEGLKSGCSYQGANSLRELKINPEFVSISNAGLQESHPHSVTIRK